MIVLEITEEAGITHYEILGLERARLAASADPAGEVHVAAKKMRKEYNVRAKQGDKEADTRLSRVNDAAATLKDARKREEYDKGLDAGIGGALDVLRVQPIAPAVYRERASRFRVVEEAMRAAGMARPLWSA
jgi:curved DNA-binding protein CbpA